MQMTVFCSFVGWIFSVLSGSSLLFHFCFAVCFGQLAISFALYTLSLSPFPLPLSPFLFSPRLSICLLTAGPNPLLPAPGHPHASSPVRPLSISWPLKESGGCPLCLFYIGLCVSFFLCLSSNGSFLLSLSSLPLSLLISFPSLSLLLFLPAHSSAFAHGIGHVCVQ